MNPLYSFIKLILATLYPAYASFKAVKEKNVREYVKWMMYWIVFAGFTAIEAIADTFLSFWFPFYQESKIVVLVWLLSPATRGSSLLYRRFIHPALLRRENDIDNMMLGLQEQGYRTVAGWSRACIQYLSQAIMQTAIQGGGGIIQHLKSSYILADVPGLENISTMDRRQHNCGTNQLKQGFQRRHISEKYNRDLKKGDIYFSEVDSNKFYGNYRKTNESQFSTDSVSSGYSSMSPLSSFCSDESFLPSTYDTMDTQNYELFDPRFQKQPTQLCLQQHNGNETRKLEVPLPLEEEEDTFYESVEMPFGFPVQHSTSAPETVDTRYQFDFGPVADNSKQNYPEDRESSPEEYSHAEDEASVIENIRFPIYSGGTGVRIMEIREDKLKSFQEDITKQHLIVNKNVDSTDVLKPITAQYQNKPSTLDLIKSSSLMENHVSKMLHQASIISESNLMNSHKNLEVAESKLKSGINVEELAVCFDGQFSCSPPSPPPRRGESCSMQGNVSRQKNIVESHIEELLPTQQEQPNQLRKEAHNQIIKEKPIQFPYQASHYTSEPSFRESSPSHSSMLPLNTNTAPHHSTAGTTASCSISKCPHCAIHSWLPHSLNCPKLKLNKNK